MSQLNAIRVLVVDDHPVVRQGLVAMLEEAPDILVVGQAGNGQEALAVFRQKQPDATLMDLRMPQMNGVAAITAICTEFPAARIIVLTTYEGDEDIYQGLRAGAKGIYSRMLNQKNCCPRFAPFTKDTSTFHPALVPNF
jgi:two-component system NarL family response regulator